MPLLAWSGYLISSSAQLFSSSCSPPPSPPPPPPPPPHCSPPLPLPAGYATATQAHDTTMLQYSRKYMKEVLPIYCTIQPVVEIYR